MSKISLRSKYSKFILFPAIALGLLVISSIYVRRNNDNQNKILPLDIVRPLEGVAALGQLSPIGEVRTLAAPVSGMGGTPRIAELFIVEGDKVIKGQPLAVFDNRDRILADIAINKARLKTIENKILFQKREVTRYKKSSLQGATSLSLYERIENDLIQSQSLKQEIIAQSQALEVDLKESQLESPINGVILKINSRVGERPGSNGVLLVGNNNSMQAIIEVYESDINRVTIGQEVSLTSENGGFTGKLSGIVSRISPQIQQRQVLSTDPTGDSDARIVQVRVTLTPQSSEQVMTFTGMKVIARFK